LKKNDIDMNRFFSNNVQVNRENALVGTIFVEREREREREREVIKQLRDLSAKAAKICQEIHIAVAHIMCCGFLFYIFYIRQKTKKYLILYLKYHEESY
jgi:hypothetical protein